MRRARPEIGSWLGPNEIPRATARALERRGLARITGSSAFLTDEGRAVADDLGTPYGGGES